MSAWTLWRTKGLIILAKERNNHSRACISQPTCRCACSAMVNNGCNVLKQPFVRAVVDEQDVFKVRRKSLAKVAPSSRDDGANATRLHSFQDNRRHSRRMLNNDAAKADVDWSLSSFDEATNICRRIIAWRIAEEKAADVYMQDLVRKTIHNGECNHKPMCSPQSGGFGTKAGDQQYVKGTFRFSISTGPTEAGMGSRSKLFLQLLIMSPSLFTERSANRSNAYGRLTLTLAKLTTRQSRN